MASVGVHGATALTYLNEVGNDCGIHPTKDADKLRECYESVFDRPGNERCGSHRMLLES